jgi:hypothetical protein
MAHRIIQVPSGGGGGAAAAPAAAGGGAAAAVEEKKEEKVEEKVCDFVNYFSMGDLTLQCRRNPTTTWASDCSIKWPSSSIVLVCSSNNSTGYPPGLPLPPCMVPRWLYISIAFRCRIEEN